MRQRLEREALNALVQQGDLSELPAQELLELFRSEATLQEHRPSGELGRDPRSGDRVLYAPRRSARPQHTDAPSQAGEEEECPICAGRTTGVIDVADLSEGFTFINKNLYPMLYPFPEPRPARGLHLLQWTSSFHDRDWHNLDPQDCAIVISRLAAIEGAVGSGWRGLLSQAERPPVAIIKNAGGAVGASLDHGHQQIAIGGPTPALHEANARFASSAGHSFADELLGSLDDEILLRDYGPALLTLVPFMKRPYEMFLVLKDTRKAHLDQLKDVELQAVARGWHDATRALHALMPKLGRPVAYNVLTANGPGAGLYFEFLPYSQTLGGFERLGLYICQMSRSQAAEDLRRALEA